MKNQLLLHAGSRHCKLFARIAGGVAKGRAIEKPIGKLTGEEKRKKSCWREAKIDNGAFLAGNEAVACMAGDRGDNMPSMCDVGQ